MPHEAVGLHGSSLTVFLGQLSQIDEKSAAEFERALVDLFRTPDGRKVLELLEKSVLLSAMPPACDDRALREWHGQRLLVAEIRRIVIYGGRPAERGNDRKR